MEADGFASIGHILRRERRRAGLTQESLAERAGISVRAISDLERGIIRAPRRDTLDLLADALELPADSRNEWMRLRRRLAVRAQTSKSPQATPTTATALVRVPTPLNELLGRDEDVAAILSLVASERLVTLIGPGGIGKTRLAISVAHAAASDFPDGVAFVELAPTRNPALVLPSIAAVLDVRQSGDQSLIDAVQGHLREKQLLLVLDNLEQVIAAAPLVTDLLEHARNLKVLATSRIRLGIRGERIWSVPPLAVPDAKSATESTMHDAAAVRLFLARATAAERDIEPTVDNLHAVAEICRRLDGLPLAIELAAARSIVLSLPNMVTRLDRSLALLTGGLRDAPARQQTQRAAIEWSFDLLGSAEQQLFRQLAVFAGGWLLDAAEAVADLSTEPDALVLDALLVLVESHLVTQRLLPDGDIRFGMLETIREFALERLTRSGEEDAIRLRHACYFLDVAETLEPTVEGRGQIEAMNLLEREHDNIRTALDWFASSGDAERGLRLAGSLGTFWQLHGHLSEGRRQYARALELPDPGVPARARAKALTFAGLLAHWQEDDDRALELEEEALSIWWDLSPTEQHGAAISLFVVGTIAMHRGDFSAAKARFEEALVQGQLADDERGWRYASFLLGVLAANHGDLDEARRRFEEGHRWAQESGDMFALSNTSHNLGYLKMIMGELDQARPMIETATQLKRELGLKKQLLNNLSNLGWIEMREGNIDSAAARFEEGLALGRELGSQAAIGMGLSNLGEVARRRGDYSQALSYFSESLGINLSIQDQLALAQDLERCVDTFVDCGDLERATRVAAAAELLRASIGAPLTPVDQAEFDCSLARLRARLPEETFSAAWKAGQSTPLADIVREILET